MKNKEISKKILYYCLAFIIPVGILLLVWSIMGIYPFGSKSLLIEWDIKEQYSNFYEYLRTIFYGNNTLTYSFSKVLGGDMIGLFAYYLSSPFNILFIILKNTSIDKVVALISILKIGFSGLTSFIFFNYLNRKIKDENFNHKKGLQVSSLGKIPTTLLYILSTAYALMAYNIIYQQNIMWIDGVIFLPLVLLGVNKILEGRSFLLYIISLGLAIIANFYTGYMIALFSFVYFFYLFFTNTKEERKNKKLKTRKWRFLCSGIISLGLSCFFLIPTILSLRGGKEFFSNPNSSLLDFSMSFNPLEFLSKLLPGAFVWLDVMGETPFIYIGLITLFLGLLYFFNQKIKLREKILSLGVLIVLYLSFSVSAMILVWHGFNLPTGFPGRNAFIFSFFFLYLAFRSLLYLKQGLSKRNFIQAYGIILIIIALVYFSGYDYVRGITSLWALLIVSFSAIALYLYYKGIKKIKLVMVLLVIILCGDLAINAYYVYREYAFTEIHEFTEFLDKNKPIYDSIEEKDEGFYRVEKNFSRTKNDNMALNIKGLSHYSSNEKNFVKNFVGQLGYERFGDVYALYGQGSTMSADSFLGIKYLVSDRTMDNGYVLIDEKQGYKVYQNPYVLPLGMMVSEKVKEINLSNEDRFIDQNKILSMNQPEVQNVLKEIKDVTISYENVKVTKNGEKLVYSKEVFDKPGIINYNFISTEKTSLYMDFSSTRQSNVNVYLNDKQIGSVLKGYTQSFLLGGSIEKNEPVTVRLEFLDNNIEIDKAMFYTEDLEALKHSKESLAKNPLELNMVDSSHLKGKVSATTETPYLLLTIPYDEGWQIDVDGKDAEVSSAMGALLLIKLDPGEHEIEFNYNANGLSLGTIVSAFSILFLILWLIIDKRKNRVGVDLDEGKK